MPKQYWFIGMEYMSMPEQQNIVSANGHGAPQQQPELVKVNKIIDVHPAVYLYRSLKEYLFFHITFAIICPPDVLKQVKREVAEAQRQGGGSMPGAGLIDPNG